MTAPFPYESVAGAVNDQAEVEASKLYGQFVWIARLVDEMNTEAELDLKRTMQLVFHSRQFRALYDTLQARVGVSHTQAQITAIIAAVFALKKCTWANTAAMLSDLSAVYNSAGTAADWIEANQADYKAGYSVNKEVSPGVMTDTPIKITKTTNIATRISNFRSLFGPKT